MIAKYDALVLPSRHDGWGVVVNEALLQGVPVIVSDHVGAKCLVESPGGAGLVFCCDDVNDLMLKIRRFVLDVDLRCGMKKSANHISNKLLPEHAARYMYDALNYYYNNKGSRPEPLWNV